MLTVTFLGTAGSVPSLDRSLPAVLFARGGDRLLFDCGEGTQRQMMRARTGFGIRAVFLSHFHADHTLGVPGLLQTLNLMGREEPLLICGPDHTEDFAERLVELGYLDLHFDVRFRTLEPGMSACFEGYEVRAFATCHSVPSVGYALVEEERPGRFDPERARELGVGEGPDFGRLQQGEPVETEGGMVEPDQVMGPPRPGRRVVYTGDSRPHEAMLPHLEGADLWISEGTFGDEFRQKAEETGHSTARAAAALAREAGVRRLILTHISTRYSDGAHLLLEQAREEFERVGLAEDLLRVEVPLPEAETG
ncbi:MAG: ribonuclease Z [bacterium]